MHNSKNFSIPMIVFALPIAIALACGGSVPTTIPGEIATEVGSSETSDPDSTAVEPIATLEPTNTLQPTDTNVPPTGSDIETLILGTWKSVCVELDPETSIITTINFDGAGQANDVVDFYSDPACTSATGLVKTNQTSYILGDNVTASGKSAYEIDLIVNSWELIQDGAVILSGTDVPTQYDIVAIEGNTLYTSGITRADPGPITTPDDRPTTLDLGNYYIRQ